VTTEERKIVTVLFADVVGFTGRADRADPETVRGLLNPFFSRVRAECEQRGGTVEKFIGDAAMAVFGTPVAHEDDPERAVRAALAIRDAVEQLNRDEPSLDLHLRLAVNTGEALVAVGSNRRENEWIATGDTVNTCARMQARAPVDGILVGEATERATRDAIEYREVEAIQAKGKSRPIRAWEALRELVAAGGDRRRRDAPLVGRAEELGLLVEALHQARRAERTQLVTLVGAPGIGKSRLVFELISVLEDSVEPIPWLEGRSLPYGEGVSSAALAEMTKTWAEILESDSAEAAREKLHAAATGLFADPGEAAWIESHLRPLVGIVDVDDARVRSREEAFAAWRRLFEALAEQQPVVLLFEDLHWADDSLLDFVDHLLDWAVDLPLLVVATARPELLDRRPDWGGGKLNALTISLAPLSAEDTQALFAALLDRIALPEKVRGELLSRTGGNPLYAGEYARMLVDRGLVRRNGVGWKLDDSMELPLPETVQGIIAARLDTLRRDEKAMLQDAAVLGETFWVGALATMGSVPRATIEERLRVLERKDFSRRARGSAVESELQYGFRHVLVRDVAYGQIPRARRAEKHQLAAEWIESVAGERVADRAEMVAYHYLTALELTEATGTNAEELRARAGKAAREAGDRAASLAAYASAERFYGTALKLTGADDPGRPELLFRAGRASFHARQEGAVELAEAREQLLARGELDLAAEADVMLAALLTSEGRRDQAHEHLQRASELVETSGSPRSRAYVLTEFARFLMLAGESEEALRVGREALAVAEGEGLQELRTQALVNVGMARVTSGDVAGTEDLEAAIALARQINSPEGVRATRMLASMHVLLGNLGRASELYADARAQADRFGNAFEKRWLAAAHAMELHWSGRWDEAVRVADAFVARSAEGSPHYMEAPVRRVRGEIRLLRGDLEGALEDAEAAVEFARVARDLWFFYPSLTFRARVLLAAGRKGEANVVVDDLLRLDGAQRSRLLLSTRTAAALTVILRVLDRGSELLDAIDRTETSTPWLAAATAYASGEFARAADLYDAIGSRPDAAEARARATEQLVAAGRHEEAQRQLAIAVEFFAQVNALPQLRELSVHQSHHE
jgi:class 3 adenylate cyclase/tetratricopeptide (TPR) repeat protein